MIPATCKSSGELTAATTVREGRSHLFGVLILTDGSNDALVQVYDNTSAAGTLLFKGSLAAAENTGYVPFNYPVRADLGLHVVITGTGASVILYYG